MLLTQNFFILFTQKLTNSPIGQKYAGLSAIGWHTLLRGWVNVHLYLPLYSCNVKCQLYTYDIYIFNADSKFSIVYETDKEKFTKKAFFESLKSHALQLQL